MSSDENDLVQRALGREAYLRDQGSVKGADLLRDLVAGLTAAQARIAELEAQLQAAQRDAERYRKVRADPSMLLHLKNSEFDAAVDAKEPCHE